MSAQRYRGPHSPKGRKTKWSGRKVDRGMGRVKVLYFWPTWLLVSALGALGGGDPLEAAQTLMIWGVLMGSAWLTKEGVKAARAYEARAVAKPPSIPRKIFGALTTALGVGLVVASGGAALASAGMWAVISGALHMWLFGPDPVKPKGLDGLEGDALDAAVTKIETARVLVEEMRAAAEITGDDLIIAKTEIVADAAEQNLARLERDPSGLSRARRFLAVYLVGARDAAVKYADGAQGEASRTRFLALLDDLAAQFGQQRAAITQSDEQALEIEIDVLRERLRAEGV